MKESDPAVGEMIREAIKEIFSKDPEFTALQKYFVGASTDTDLAPAREIVAALPSVALGGITRIMAVNFCAGLAVNVAEIVAGPDAAKIVRAAAGKRHIRKIEYYQAGAAAVMAEVLGLRERDDFWLFTHKEVSPAFVERMRTGDNAVSEFLRNALSLPSDTTNEINEEFQKALADKLNVVLSEESIYESLKLAKVSIPKHLRSLVAAAIAPSQYRSVNRLIIEAAFPAIFSRREKIVSYLSGHPQLRANLKLLECCTWLADHSIDSFEDLCRETHLRSPNLLSGAAVAKQAVKRYKALDPEDQKVFREQFNKENLIAREPLSSGDALNHLKQVIESGDAVEGEVLKAEICRSLSLPGVKQEQTWDDLVQNVCQAFQHLPDQERPSKLNALTELLKQFVPEDTKSKAHKRQTKRTETVEMPTP